MLILWGYIIVGVAAAAIFAYVIRNLDNDTSDEADELRSVMDGVVSPQVLVGIAGLLWPFMLMIFVLLALEGQKK